MTVDLSDYSKLLSAGAGYSDLGPESVTLRCSVAGSVEPGADHAVRGTRSDSQHRWPAAPRTRPARDQRGLETCERYALEPPSWFRLWTRGRRERRLRRSGRPIRSVRGARRVVRSRRVLLRGPVQPAAVPVRPVRRVLGGVLRAGALRGRAGLRPGLPHGALRGDVLRAGGLPRDRLRA